MKIPASAVFFWCAAASFDAGGGGSTGGNCVTWDLAAVSVPESVAFRAKGSSDPWVSFDAKPEDVWSYWDRLEAATKAAGTKGLHEALGLNGNLTSAMADVMAA